MKINIDTHSHTFVSKCCQDRERTPLKAAELLSKKGFKLIAVTDHLWDNPAVQPNNWLRRHPREELESLVNEMRQTVFPIKVLASCEADMQGPGRIGITPEFKEKLDFVSVASDHFQLRDFTDQPVPAVPEKLAPLMMAMFRDAVRSGLADVLLHPLFPDGYHELYDDTLACVSDAELFDSLSEAAERKVALEINCGVLNARRSGKFSMESLYRVFETAKKAGCLFTVGSDSHNDGHFELYHLAEDFTERMNITEEDIHPLFRVS